MDPLTLIVTALAAGASAALKESAGDAVKSAYGKLKDLLVRKLSGRPHGEAVLEGNEEDPDVWKEPLKKELEQAGADRDDDIVRAAKELADLVAPAASESYTMNVVNRAPVGHQINIQHADRVGFGDDDPTG
jgi:hypothetical protein